MTIAQDLPSLGSLREEQRALRAELARLRQRLKLQLALELAVDAITSLVASAAVLVFLDWWLRFGVQARVAILTLSLAGILGFLVVRAIGRWRSSRLDELSLAMALDRYRPGTGQQIADILQLPDLLDEQTSSASPAMIRLAVRQATEALAQSDWRTLWNRKRTTLHSGALALGLVIPLVFGLAAPDAARLSVARWLFGSSERWPQRTYLTVMGLDDRGRLLAPRDERVVLDVRSDLPQLESRDGRWILPGRGEPFTLRRKPNAPRNPKTVRVGERTAEGVTRAGIMVATGPSQFRFEFPASPTSSTFDLVGGDDWLGPLKLERIDRPSLGEIKLRVREPGAAAGAFRVVPDPRQHLLFLPDTEMELTLVGSEPLADIQLKFHPEGSTELKRIDERTYVVRWALREATTLEVVLTSAKSRLLSRPAFLSIGLLRDREPRVTLRAVGVGSHVTPVATIPLTIAATDDFGLAALRLRDERTTNVDETSEAKTPPKTERKLVNLPLSPEQGRAILDHQARHEVLLQTEPPAVGTVLRFMAEAEDRCSRGAQVGRSSTLQLQVVSPDELFYELLIRQRAERAKFVTLLETLEKQTPVLEGNPTAEEIVKISRVEQSAGRQIDQIAARIGDALQEMKLNQIGSPKSHRLLQDAIINPLKALSQGPVNELRGVLQNLAAGSSTPTANKESARKLHKEVVSKMQAVLDQMSQWESFVDVVNQVAEVIRMQQKVLQNTEKARESRTQEIFDAKP